MSNLHKPAVESGESRRKYMERAIPEAVENNEGVSAAQAVEICRRTYDEHASKTINGSKKKGWKP